MQKFLSNRLLKKPAVWQQLCHEIKTIYGCLPVSGRNHNLHLTLLLVLILSIYLNSSNETTLKSPFILNLLLRGKCPHSEFFDLFPVRIQEIKDQKNSKYGHFSHKTLCLIQEKATLSIPYFIKKMLFPANLLFQGICLSSFFHILSYIRSFNFNSF